MEPDYHKAKLAAQKKANDLQMLVRIRAVVEFGKHGYVFNLAPSLEKQFGRDLEGELIRPQYGIARG